MALPYKIATLVYAFNQADDVLLLKRNRDPNRGLWSPFGGKLETTTGESPHACAARETLEELDLNVPPTGFHLTGLISEHGYQGEANWLMFLFELRQRLTSLPQPIDEGVFQFYPREAITQLDIPETDRERIWPLFWQHRSGFFSAHCECLGTSNRWTLEQSQPNPQST